MSSWDASGVAVVLGQPESAVSAGGEGGNGIRTSVMMCTVSRAARWPLAMLQGYVRVMSMESKLGEDGASYPQ